MEFNFYSKKIINKIIVLFIVTYIFFGFIYKLNFENLNINITLVRNFFIIILLIILLIGLYKDKFNKDLLYSSIIVIFSIILNGVSKTTEIENLIKPVFQAIFTFSIIQYSINNSNLIFEQLSKYKNFLIIIVLIFWTANFFALTNDGFLKNYIEGFGGNRVNFSISCVQIIGLSILIGLHTIKNNQEEIILFTAILGIIAAQVISGGRAGLLISTLIYIALIIFIFKKN